ncbi:hypothetical protein ACEPAI_3345 [Sanghuangporus weigelae]
MRKVVEFQEGTAQHSKKRRTHRRTAEETAEEEKENDIPSGVGPLTSDWSSDDNDTVNSSSDEDSRRIKGGRGTIQKRLLSWIPERNSYLNEILRHEGRQGCREDGLCTSCAEKIGNFGQYRCIDCGPASLLCKTCICDSHKMMPFHRIEQHTKSWTGQIFKKTSLKSLGYRIQLGHYGQSCVTPISGHKDFIVLDITGFHSVDIDFCRCGEFVPYHIQLLRSRLFSASRKRPRTAFTFDVLDLFHELTLQSKINAHDFYQSMLRRTDNSKPHEFYGYDDFTISIRLWKHLMMLKRAGRGHSATGAAGTEEGELTIECPACPHPGRNLPREWESLPSEKRWIHTQFLAVDRNFRLWLKDRGIKDVDLAPGWSYYVDNARYNAILQTLPTSRVDNTCRSHRNAVMQANTWSDEGRAATGVAAVVCGRHAFVLPGGVGNLRKGECYSNIDYILLSSVKRSKLKDLFISYHIACQWKKNFTKRMLQFPQDMRLDSTAVNIRSAVPKFDLYAHGESCQASEDMNYLPYVGRTYGERVGMTWAHLKTREMGMYARQETLNDHWTGWNWRKSIYLGPQLKKMLKEANKESARSEKALAEFSSMFPRETVSQCEAEVLAWYADCSSTNPFHENTSNTSLKDIRLQFAKEDAEDARKGALTPAFMSEKEFLSCGLDLEAQQIALQLSFDSDSCVRSLSETKREALCRQIIKWRKIQDIYMPGAALFRSEAVKDQTTEAIRPEGTMRLLDADGSGKQNDDHALDDRDKDNSSGLSSSGSGRNPIDPKENSSYQNDAPDIATINVTSNTVEHAPLYLPSSLSPSMVDSRLRSIELRLRLGQADDALEKIRSYRRTLHEVGVMRNMHVSETGNRPYTRIQAVFERFQSKVKQYVEVYRKAQNALEVLDSKGEWKKKFQVLYDEDVRGPGKTSDGSLPELGEHLRCEWAKLRAKRDRWREEIELVMEEMRRTLVFLIWKAKQWDQRVKSSDFGSKELNEGLRAYATKQADIQQNLAICFFRLWYPTLGRLEKTPVWLTEIHPLFRPNESHDSVNVSPPISDVEEEQLRKFMENMELERLFGPARDADEELDSLLPDSDDE